MRERHGDGFEAFLRQKITPIHGDITLPLCGVTDEVRDQLRGTMTALVNSSGVVDFNPPLDYALNTNAFGMKNLVALCQDLGPAGGSGLPMLHTSTCDVAGDRTGQVDEV
ncbi:MAG: SDR family oxidoreductase, partial [bacterium]